MAKMKTLIGHIACTAYLENMYVLAVIISTNNIWIVSIKCGRTIVPIRAIKIKFCRTTYTRSRKKNRVAIRTGNLLSLYAIDLSPLSRTLIIEFLNLV